jgi:hypothetical protein
VDTLLGNAPYLVYLISFSFVCSAAEVAVRYRHVLWALEERGEALTDDEDVAEWKQIVRFMKASQTPDLASYHLICIAHAPQHFNVACRRNNE